MIPVLPHDVLTKAKTIWKESLAGYGRLVDVHDQDGATLAAGVKAFCKRPKILGLFDRTEQSFDQERYMVILDVDTVPNEPEKFFSIRWDQEDHSVISTTQVDLLGTVFGYRVLCKG
jgi:hypothetical protein